MKIHIYEIVETSPIYVATDKDIYFDVNKEVEIDEETYNEFMEAKRKYEAMQKMLSYLFKEAE